MKIRILTLLVLLLFASSVTAQDEAVQIDKAMVTSIHIDDSNGIVIMIEGDLPDSCTEVGEISQSLEDDTITLLVETTRPADAMCAAVITAFELSYELDISEIPAGEYTLDVNGVIEEITIIASADAETVELSCPKADEETILFEDLGMCFVYPSEFEEISGKDFVLISQPLTSNAVLLIEIEDADDVTLDDLSEEFEDAELIIDELVIGGEDALIIETDDTREAYIIVNEQLYSFFVQPIDDEEETGELLWSVVIDSVFFPEQEEE